MESNRSRLYIIFFAAIFLFIIAICVVIFRANQHTSQKQEDITIFPTAAPLFYKSQSVISVMPTYTTVLNPGKNEEFTIRLSQSILHNSLKILLTKVKPSETSDKTTSVPISTAFKDSGKTIIVSMQEPVEIYHEYSLIIIDQNNKTLLSTTYLTSNVEISVVQKNNLELKQFLPYETLNYKLSYNELRNEYIFNFKVDPSSPTGFKEQYEEAK